MYINGSFLSQHQSGVQRYASDICQRLLRSGQATLLVKDADSAGSFPQENVQVIAPGPVSRNVSKSFWALYEIQSRLKQDDVLWHPANIAFPVHGKHIVTIHDMSVYAGRQWFKKSFLAKYYALLPIVAARAWHILTVSEFSKAEIVRYLRVPEKQISVGYNGVGDQFRPCACADIERVRAKHGLSRPYILSVGTLEPRKNLPRLIEAWKMSGLESEYDLVLVGGKVSLFSETAINGSNTASDSIRFLGYVDDPDLPSIYAGSRAFVYLSLYEGFGLPILEALACGCSVLASDIPVFRELFSGGVQFTNPINVESICESLKYLVANPIVPPTRASLIDRFSWEQTSQILLGVANK